MKHRIFTLGLAMAALLQAGSLEDARDRQDLPALSAEAAKLGSAAQKGDSSAKAHYLFARAQSLVAEVAMEKGDKKGSASAAETGITAAQKAVQLESGNSEYHRILGTLCGQVIPANVMLGLKYGRCAMDEVAKAVELNPKSAENLMSRGVGNYYLPPSFGGGIDKAVEDFDKSIALNANLAEAHLWRGLALRKQGKNAEARKALTRSLELNPKRLWAKTQLEKTPEK
jgi:tetratricopeptide (TPR) repeat protein